MIRDTGYAMFDLVSRIPDPGSRIHKVLHSRQPHQPFVLRRAAGNQTPGVWMLRVFEYLSHLPLLHHLTLVHHNYPVSKPGDKTQIVGDEEDAHVPLLLKSFQ